MRATIDGNEAAVDVAYRLNELCAIYPITPSSTMAELADEWASHGRTNVWGTVPTVIEMQSEGGAAGAMHGALQGGALSTTFTASQGLLLMIPNMYKIAGELTSTVFHVAARSLAAQGLSIFGDHSDVMAVRQTGFALLSSASVQEAHDLALVAQAATLRTRVPFVHFFDGFRTSHELNTIELLDDDVLRAMVPEDLVREHRSRALTPERPFIRGTAQNPDVYFQARETVNPFYARTSRRGAGRPWTSWPRTPAGPTASSSTPATPRPSGSSSSWAPAARRPARRCATSSRPASGSACCRCGSTARSRRPSSSPPCRHACAGSPCSTGPRSPARTASRSTSTCRHPRRGPPARPTRAPAPGHRRPLRPVVQGVHPRHGRRHLRRAGAPAPAVAASRSASPTTSAAPACPTTPTSTSRSPRPCGPSSTASAPTARSGANKNTIKILGADPDVHAQAYFVYDSKKSGGLTVSHLRFGPHPIRAPYLVTRAGFVGCHHLGLLDKVDVLALARARRDPAAQRPAPAGRGVGRTPADRAAADQRPAACACSPIDADRVARDAGLPGRTNTVLQTCFFAISGVLPRDEAIAQVKAAIRKTYARRGTEVVRRNEAAVDATLAALHEVAVPAGVAAGHELVPPVPADAPEFVRTVTAEMMAGRGDALPVSALPVDGTFPSGTTAYEKRRISDLVALWDPEACIQCGTCSFVCPHSVIRSKYYDEHELDGAPEAFASAPLDAVGLPGARYTLQVYVEDCTGLRPLRRGLPGQPRSASRRARRSTSPSSSRSSSRRGRTSPSSRRCPSTTAPASTSARCAARSSSSRSSSSPAPAPAAARRPTSSCSPSSSASG